MKELSSRVGEARSLLRNRSFRRLWVAQFSAVAAVYGLGLAGLVLVEDRTHSSAQTGLVILSSILPAFLGSLVAGAVVDRWGRVWVLMASHLTRALVALAFWAGIQLFPPGLVLTTVYTVNVAVALLSQFATPAEMALLPDLVHRTRLMAANTLFQLGMLIAEGLGIVLLGPLAIKLAGVSAVGLGGALLCLLALSLVAILPRDHIRMDPAGKKWVGWVALGSDLQAGWRVIAQDRLLGLITLQATLAAALLLVLLSLGPGLVSRHLGMEVEDASFLLLPGGVGFVLGGFVVNRWEERLSRQGWIAAGLIIVGLNVALLAALTSGGGWFRLLLSLILTLGVGLALALVIIPARTVLQERPPPAVRGRVIAAQLALGNAIAVIPLLMGGVLADSLGIRPVMGLLGLLAVGGGAAGLLYARAFATSKI